MESRLRQGSAGQPPLPEQEAAALVQQVRQQLVLRDRLARQLGWGLKSLKFVSKGRSIDMSEAYS